MTTLIDYFLILEFNKRNKLDISNKKILFKRYSKFRKKNRKGGSILFSLKKLKKMSKSHYLQYQNWNKTQNQN